jgi:hypothetical protein
LSADDEARAVAELERRNALDHFERDPYAARAPLADKRAARGWNDARLEAVAEGQDGAVRRLLWWRGGESGREIFSETLPWEEVEEMKREVDARVSIRDT